MACTMIEKRERIINMSYCAHDFSLRATVTARTMQPVNIHIPARRGWESALLRLNGWAICKHSVLLVQRDRKEDEKRKENKIKTR